MGNHSDIHTHSHRHSSSHTSVLRRPPSILSHTSSIHTILFTLTSTPHNRSDIHTHSHRHSSSHTSISTRFPSILSHTSSILHPQLYTLPPWPCHYSPPTHAQPPSQNSTPPFH